MIFKCNDFQSIINVRICTEFLLLQMELGLLTPVDITLQVSSNAMSRIVELEVQTQSQ